ncbi:hypothetical protein HY991_05990 [Candidatus Micrarchaeota archaeon]|nr:hypothetical protein [Candidatus Micrarchaeota archaeon]
MRGQTGIELMVFIGILLVVFVVFMAVANTKREDVERDVGILSAKQVVETASSHINSAVSVGDGYHATFLLPVTLQNGVSYTLQFVPGNQRVYIQWEEKEWSSPILTSNIHDCTGACNPFAVGENTVENKGGEIWISN